MRQRQSDKNKLVVLTVVMQVPNELPITKLRKEVRTRINDGCQVGYLHLVNNSWESLDETNCFARKVK